MKISGIDGMGIGEIGKRWKRLGGMPAAAAVAVFYSGAMSIIAKAKAKSKNTPTSSKLFMKFRDSIIERLSCLCRRRLALPPKANPTTTARKYTVVSPRRLPMWQPQFRGNRSKKTFWVVVSRIETPKKSKNFKSNSTFSIASLTI